MLFVFVKEIVEDFFVEQCNTLEIVATARLEADDFVDEAVGLMRQVSDILLTLHLLLDVCRVISDLQLNRI